MWLVSVMFSLHIIMNNEYGNQPESTRNTISYFPPYRHGWPSIWKNKILENWIFPWIVFRWVDASLRYQSHFIIRVDAEHCHRNSFCLESHLHPIYEWKNKTKITASIASIYFAFLINRNKELRRIAFASKPYLKFNSVIFSWCRKWCMKLFRSIVHRTNSTCCCLHSTVELVFNARETNHLTEYYFFLALVIRVFCFFPPEIIRQRN